MAELARTLEGMLGALDAARSETEAALNRQREFVADASHELRTPLTSVLANLELLADELEGEPAGIGQGGAALDPADAPAGGRPAVARPGRCRAPAPGAAHGPGRGAADAAAELGAVAAESHHLTIDPAPAMVREPDDLHRLVLNLMENAVSHTPAGTQQSVPAPAVVDGIPTLIVEDDGPGIPAELPAAHVRSVRARRRRLGGGSRHRPRAGDRARGGRLPWSRVELASLPDGSGTRFVISFDAAAPDPVGGTGADGLGKSSLRT